MYLGIGIGLFTRPGEGFCRLGAGITLPGGADEVGIGGGPLRMGGGPTRTGGLALPGGGGRGALPGEGPGGGRCPVRISINTLLKCIGNKCNSNSGLSCRK